MSDVGDEATGRVQLRKAVKPPGAVPREQWRFRVYGLNNELIHISEAYTRRADALRGFEDLRAALAHPIIDAGD